MNGIKALRLKAGLSQVQLAKQSGLSIETIKKYEQGERSEARMSLITAQKLADVLQMSPGDLVDYITQA